jgi:hypothetical protein
MSDLDERLRMWPAADGQDGLSSGYVEALMREAADENKRLSELLRGTGANRYWEGRWRDEKAENEKLRTLLGKLYWQLDGCPVKHPQQAEERARARDLLGADQQTAEPSK